MWVSRRACSASLLLVLACGGGCRGDRTPSTVPKKRAPRSDRAAPPPALENARGVVGGPRDETAFEFEPEPPTEADAPPLLEGVPPIPEEIKQELLPYLEARRTRVASVAASGPSLVVLTRRDEVTQAYALDRPRGRLRQLTRGEDPVAQAAFIPGRENLLLFRRDQDGDERYQLFRVNVSTGEETLLTDGESRHGSFALARDGRVAFTSNQRASGDLDVYASPVRDAFAPAALVARGGQWLVGTWSRDARRLFVRRYRSAGESSGFLVDVTDQNLTPLDLGAGEGLMRAARFSPAGDAVYVIADGGGDHAGLYRVELPGGEAASLSGGVDWPVEHVAMSTDGERVAFVANEDGASALYLVDTTTGKRTRAQHIPRGVIASLHFFGTTKMLALTLGTATEPADAYLYDPKRQKLSRWTESESDVLDRKPFVEPSLVRISSFDELQIPAYLYRPPGDGPFPVLLWIHGGPEEQHRPVLDPLLQYFVTERGYAVVAPNIRGSAGYGREYLGLDDGMRRLDAIKDIGALLDWIEAKEELDPARVGIFGASYGGYVVLASLVEYGERLAAGCDLVGISHFVTFLQNTSEYRRDQRRAEYGDERDDEMRDYLERISPLTNVERLRTPLLVGHGANDPRVPVEEAEQIVRAVREGGADVWYMLARDEGHGFRKRRSRDLFYAVMVTFFDRHLR